MGTKLTKAIVEWDHRQGNNSRQDMNKSRPGHGNNSGLGLGANADVG